MAEMTVVLGFRDEWEFAKWKKRVYSSKQRQQHELRCGENGAEGIQCD